MAWLAIVPVLFAVLAIHELVMRVLARALGGTARVWVDGKRRVALALLGAAAAAYVCVSVVALVYYAKFGERTGRASWTVGEVKDGMPSAGLLAPGDRIVAVNGQPLEYPRDSLVARVNDRAGAPVSLSIERDGTRREVTIQPVSREGKFLLGIVPRLDYESDSSLGTIAPAAFAYPVRTAHQLGRELWRSVAPEHVVPGGPIRIVDEFTRSEESYVAWAWFLRAAAVLLLVLVVLDLVRAGRLVVLGSRA